MFNIGALCNAHFFYHKGRCRVVENAWCDMSLKHTHPSPPCSVSSLPRWRPSISAWEFSHVHLLIATKANNQAKTNTQHYFQKFITVGGKNPLLSSSHFEEFVLGQFHWQGIPNNLVFTQFGVFCIIKILGKSIQRYYFGIGKRVILNIHYLPLPL